MVEKRRGLPVGLLIATPPMLAALYFWTLWLAYKLLGWDTPEPLLAPLAWFAFRVFKPLTEMVGWDPPGVDSWSFAAVFGLVWTAAFLVVGFVLASLAALVNLLWPSGGSGDQGG